MSSAALLHLLAGKVRVAEGDRQPDGPERAAGADSRPPHANVERTRQLVQEGEDVALVSNLSRVDLRRLD
jgi:hypothetical protein